MREVWKYQITGAVTLIDMPIGATVLTAQYQRDIICIWVLVNTEEEEKETRKFRMYGIGHLINSNTELKYISMVQIPGSYLVFHIFEEV